MHVIIRFLVLKSRRAYTSIRLLNIVNESCTIRLPDNTHHLSHTRSNYHSFKHSNTHTRAHTTYRWVHIGLWLYYIVCSLLIAHQYTSHAHTWEHLCEAYHTFCCFCFYHSRRLCSADIWTCYVLFMGMRVFISLSMIVESNRPVLARTHMPCTFAHKYNGTQTNARSINDLGVNIVTLPIGCAVVCHSFKTISWFPISPIYQQIQWMRSFTHRKSKLKCIQPYKPASQSPMYGAIKL